MAIYFYANHSGGIRVQSITVSLTEQLDGSGYVKVITKERNGSQDVQLLAGKDDIQDYGYYNGLVVEAVSFEGGYIVKPDSINIYKGQSNKGEQIGEDLDIGEVWSIRYQGKVFDFITEDIIIDFTPQKSSSSIKSGDLYVLVNGVKKRLMVYKVDDYGRPIGNPIGHLVAK